MKFYSIDMGGNSSAEAFLEKIKEDAFRRLILKDSGRFLETEM